MRKFAIATTAAAMILGLGAGAASADERHGWKPDSHHQTERRGDVRRRAPAIETVRIGVHRRYFDEIIPLRRLLGLGHDYRGYRIQWVTVKVKPYRTRARLALLADGQVVDRARARGSRRIVLSPYSERTLGRDLDRLQLAVRGRVFIDSIQVNLRPPRHGRRARGGYRTNANHRTQSPDLTEQVVRIILGKIEVAGGRY